MILLLYNGMNFMFVIFLICSSSFFLFEFFFEFIQTFQFAMWPTLYPMFSTLFFQGGDTDAEFSSGGINGEMETTRKILIG